ncbi:hypothetical protein [Kitasatospora sp. NPDC050543]|uniref:hypothetical protein n=1 Tax=Kitasatospora sp. NPDC050543 TaxID=3364054 RepID=UPI0037B833D0
MTVSGTAWGDEPGLRPLTDQLLLDTWEWASALAPVARPLALLASAYPHYGWDELAAEPLGRCEALLAGVRRSLVGDLVEAVASCPSCADVVEVAFRLSSLCDSGPAARGEAAEAAGPAGVRAVVQVTAGGHEIRCRPVTTGDLLAVRGVPDAGAALLARCVTAVGRRGGAVPTEELPEEVRAAVEAALAAADPQAETLLGLDCPGCGARWWAPFDLAAFLWAEVEQLALHTLAEVDTLARAYGWRESDILALGQFRRRRYLDLVMA